MSAQALDPAPLDGIRVLDLSRLTAGAFASMLLADFGADVITIDDTGAGDDLRQVALVDEAALPSASFLALNRGKRSAQIDLDAPDGKAAFLRLVEQADVVLESFRPGMLDQLGLGYALLAEINPRIVLCSVSGFGQTGPAAQRPGEDITVLALTGALELTGELDGPPIAPAIPVATLAGGGLMAVIGILLALAERERSGRGQRVDVSMYDGALAMMVTHVAELFAGGRSPERGTTLSSGGRACSLPYLCKDGWIALGAVAPERWANLCRGLARPDLREHHHAPTDSWAHGQLELIFLRRSRAEWAAFADAHDCGLEPVLRLDEALASELARAREMVLPLAPTGITGARGLGLPLKLSRTPGDPLRSAAPELGEHTGAVLEEAGLDREQIVSLFRAGAVAGSER